MIKVFGFQLHLLIGSLVFNIDLRHTWFTRQLGNSTTKPSESTQYADEANTELKARQEGHIQQDGGRI